MSTSGRVPSATAAGALVLIASFPAGDVLAGSSEDTNKVSTALSIYATMDEQERARLKRAIGQSLEQPRPQRAARIPPNPPSAALAALPNATEASAAPARVADRVPLPAKQDEAPNRAYERCRGFVPLLRKDWKDIGIANCPQSVAKATGAEISYSRDQIKQNTNWSLDGTAALLYNFAGAGSYSTSTGVYVTANRSTNSAVPEADANANKLAYGGVFEYGTVNSGDVYSASYFRVRGGSVEDRIKKTTASNLTLEWLPVYEDYSRVHIHSPFRPFAGVPLIVRFDPSLLVQYASIVNGSRPLAFNDMNRALRIGPQLAMTLYPGTSDFFSHFVGAVSYHWAYETYSGRGLSLFQSSLTYNFDKDGYIGLTGSYGRGNDEDTGALSNIYKISLTGKI
jgi:hypothetical protein